ncbi:hypothetical protein BGZ83_004122, partial [Gryganskiella cystojenkinii]
AVTWDPSFCKWEGTVPWCNSDCPDGNELRCTTEERSCFRGNKGLCCPSEKEADCCKIMNGLNSDAYNALLKYAPSVAKEFHDDCERMRNGDQPH